MVTRLLVRPNFYCDSVALMTLARALTSLPGVEDAAAVMSTEMNQTLLRQAGLLTEESASAETGGQNDLLIVVRAESAEAADTAMQTAEDRLQARANNQAATQAQQRPTSLEQAVQQHPTINLALISTPGAYAAVEARQALLAGLHVFLFSDNVSLEQEITLKRLAVEHGLLLMGPDCGTAILNGIGLGFANVVPRGPVGIVSASGTGLQQVSSLVAGYGAGISQAIGTGGRDLSQAVGGRMMLAGLDLLQQDPDTRVIVLLSKPPAPEVAQRILAAAAQGTKPTVITFLGADPATNDHPLASHIQPARTLSDAARLAVRLAGGQAPPPGDALPDETLAALQPAKKALKPGQRHVRGLFSGGSLCDEAMLLLSARLGPIYSNIPLRPDWRLADARISQAHTAIDFGSDEFTIGRPHPMIDAGLRLRRLAQEAQDPTTAVILLDIVLGYASHPDPASEFAPAIARARTAAAEGRALTCIISLCGTEQDPQGLSAQRDQLRQAGALVFTENALAARAAAEIVSELPGIQRQ